MASYAVKVANKVERIVEEVEERDWLDAIFMAVRLCVAMAAQWKKLSGLEKKAMLIEGIQIGIYRLKEAGKLPWMTSTLEFTFSQVILPPLIETVYRSFLMEKDVTKEIEADWDDDDDIDEDNLEDEDEDEDEDENEDEEGEEEK